MTTLTAQPAAAASRLVAALELAWTAIRDRHPEVPEVVLVVASGSDPRGRSLTLGHFAAARWQLADTTHRAEVLVSGEGLRRGALDVLGTLLHEAAHGLAHARGIKETSREGRYHNRRFAQLAEELGIEVAHVQPLGWSATTVPASTADAYDATVSALGAALVLWRRAELAATSAGPSPARRRVVCVCTCERRIHVVRSTLEQGPILCGACGDPFTPDES